MSEATSPITTEQFFVVDNPELDQVTNEAFVAEEPTDADLLDIAADEAEESRRPRATHLAGYTEDGMGQYLNEIGTIPLLTKDQEIDLAIKIAAARTAKQELSEAGENIEFAARRKLERTIRSGDNATEDMIRANLRLVVSIAKKYPVPAGMEKLDLIQHGNLGMMHAVEKFDHTRGFKFSTYATFWIRQAILRALDGADEIRLKGNKSGELRNALKIGAVLTEEQQKNYNLSRPVHLDQKTGDDINAASLAELIADETAIQPESITDVLGDRFVIDACLNALDKNYRLIIEAKHLKGMNFEEIGQEIGPKISRNGKPLTGSRIQQLHARAMARLKDEKDESLLY